MPSPARVLWLSVSTSSAAFLAGGTVQAQVQPPSSGDRVLGLDISAWQGNIAQSTWNNIRNVEDRQFVFIRSSRGGTTGYYNQSDPNNNNGSNTFSQRYDDPYFVQNITRATNAGMLAGSYHFSRPDIIESTFNSGGIRNSGTDEADHFIQMAGAWMRPGYLLPVHDLEAGISQRSRNELTQFALDFSNRVHQVMGIRPAVYINGSYTDYVNGASSSLRTQLPTAYPTLWVARWPNQTDPNSIPVQTSSPKDTYNSFYGPWNALGTQPWQLWQYTSTGRLQSFNNGGSNLDMNVAQGNIEFMKDQLVPAIWMNNSDGNWSTLSNWNSGQTPIAPVQGPGQVARVGSLTLPTPRLPGQPDTVNAGVSGLDDNVTLNRPNADITVTLSSGTHNLRRLNLNERLNVTGGSVNARLTGWVGTGGTLSLSGGNATFTEGYINGGGVLDFAGNGTLNVGMLFLDGNPTFTGASGTGQILGKAGFRNPSLNLMGGTRSFDVADGSASTDMRIAIPLTNGNLTKTGTGTLELTGNNSAYTGILNVADGHLLVTADNQLGTDVRTLQSSATAGGGVRLQGNGLRFTGSMRIGGLGPSEGGGALENVSGDNTWAGTVFLNGAQHNQGNAKLNQIGSTNGTLTLSGLIRNDFGTASASWAKIGSGDVVLTGASPNTYTNLTRVFDGRLIIEKDGALGATNQAVAESSTIQLAGANSVVAFRAPTGSAGLNYTAQEWIFTEGGGVNGAQLDNLGGANTFAGHFGLGGPVVDGVQQASIGVTAGSLELQGGLHARGTTGSTGPETRNIYKRGNGTLILSGTNAGGPTNSFARALGEDSTFTIDAGTVQLKGTAGNGANVAGVNRWNVNNGGLLSLGLGAAGAADVQFNGGTLRVERSMLAANSLTFTGNGTIDNGVSAAAFDGNVTGSGNLTKTGSGNVSLGGAVNDFRGGINVTGGTLGVTQNGGDSRIANINGISIAGNSRFDLADNDLVIRTTSAAAVESFVAAGYAGGDWNGAGGIVSSTATANDWIYTLGVADNARLGRTSFGGHAGLTGDETFVKYTFYGDADLSGAVNAADFARFRAGFAGEMDAAWLFGDFDYNGVVDGSDFELYLFGFLNQPSNNAGNDFYNDLTTFAVDHGFDPTMVPEPTGVALLAIGAGLLLRRQRVGKRS